MPKTHDVISREEAAKQGRKTYFTAEPCKHGHTAPRYVTNAGCLECIGKWKRASAKNPYSHDLEPYMGVTFWVSKRLSPEQLAGLEPYLQKCIETYCAHFLPPICKTCDGTRYVPAGPGSGGQWKLCPDCPTEVPTSGDSPTASSGA